MDRDFHPHESGRHRPPYESLRSPSTRRSPTPGSNVYAPFASASRPILPPLAPPVPLPPPPPPSTNSPPRGMPSSAYPPYRPQSPPRFAEDPTAFSSHYSSASAGLWSDSITRGIPSQATTLPPTSSYPTVYDMRPFSAQPSSYYHSPTAFQDQRSRLPPLAVDTYLPRGSSNSPSYPYQNTTASRAATYYPSTSPQQRPSYATVPFTSTGAEWGSATGLTDLHRTDHYASNPYGYGASSTHDRSGGGSGADPWGTGSGEPLSPSSERADSSEPLVKKKRKRADANQLRVLNATYQRTAFPSTQEREALAKELDMSPRSVQIWFQNKRQSMRQSRNAANNLPPILHHTYSSPNPAEPRPTHQSYHALSEASSSSRRREGTPSDDHRHRR